MVIKYRPDIDGLRAIAVLAVVLYHYGIGPIHGGFVGVDIFFVISGYLITGIIHKEIGRGDFTFVGFYERRIRRIFPALFAVLLATLAVGGWLLLPSDLAKLGNSTLATLLFGSNVLFWRQSGYFDTSSEYNPLLHTWSLAVEEQFYIGLPILLILLHRFAKGWLKLALVACAFASFALCIWVQPLRPSAAFFLSPFRAWELLLGGLLAVGAIPPIYDKRLRSAISMGALALLFWSLWWIQAGPGFPGWRAALPVLGTAALLHAGAHGDSWVKRLLSWRPLAFVGLISYSLYLWHWPLMVFVRYRNGMEPLAPAMGGLLLVVAILLAAASYRWIETPFRRNRSIAGTPARNRLFAGAGIVMVAVAGIALLVKADQGWQARFSADVVALDQARHPVIPFRECDGHPPDFAGIECRIGVKGAPLRVLLWGDSHALAWAPAMNEILKRQGVAGILAVNSACPPLLGVNNPVDTVCHSDNERLMRAIGSRHFDTIILHASWTSYSDPEGQYTLTDEQGRTGNANVFTPAFDRTIRALRSLAGRIVLVGPTSGAPSDIPFRLASAARRMQAYPPGRSATDVQLHARWFWQVAQRYRNDPQVVLVDPSRWFCSVQSCRYLSDDGKLLYRDGGHLSLAGAWFVASHFSSDVSGRDGQWLQPASELH